MKKQIAVVTYDLVAGREKLMPWRTVLEVVRRMRARGHDARVVSINRGAEGSCLHEDFGVPVWACPSVHNLQSHIVSTHENDFSPDLVYWPVTWRSGMVPGSCWHGWDCPTIAYQGGSCYHVLHVIAAIRWMPSFQLKGLLIETFLPKRFLVTQFHKKNISGVICMSDATMQAFVKAGWPSEKSLALPPGLPSEEKNGADLPRYEKSVLIDLESRYVLFLGNPLPIRGTDVLLFAAEKVFAQDADAAIICLFRPDPGAEMTLARKKIMNRARLRGIDRQFVCITQKLPARDVRQCTQNARAVVMPFLFVPSEIPLGILEAIQMGTPVITTQSGGTSEFVGNAGWIVPPGNASALADAILAALNDDNQRAEKVKSCHEKMKDHPTWDAVGDAWLEFGLNAAKGRKA